MLALARGSWVPPLMLCVAYLARCNSPASTGSCVIRAERILVNDRAGVRSQFFLFLFFK